MASINMLLLLASLLQFIFALAFATYATRNPFELAFYLITLTLSSKCLSHPSLILTP